MNRRQFVGATAAAVALSSRADGRAARGAGGMQPAGIAEDQGPPSLKGRVKHSVCRWCYGGMKLDDLCERARAIGIGSVELLTEKEWPTAKARGLECAVAMGPTQIGKGLNKPEHHQAAITEGERILRLIKDAGFATMPHLIVFSGNREPGLSDADGLKNCADALRRLVPTAEKLGITIIMELLNSKVDHKGYMCDRTPWGVELVQKVGSPRFKLLYDIYHMQIMEGDVIRTITDNSDSIAHFHTGGVPGRNEIDQRQELNYRRIIEAIVDKGYTGWIGQEFIPTGDAMLELASAVRICDV
ncbi:MAG: TIM barrel protein [Phycisphaerales bacterium]|nr:TIM barrel protein [Phycisphaerales bacterium]